MPRSKKINESQREYIVNHQNETVEKLSEATGLKPEHVRKVLDCLPKTEAKPSMESLEEVEKQKKKSNLSHTLFDKEAASKGAIVMTGAQAALNNPDKPFRQSLNNEEWYKNTNFIAPIVINKPNG